MIVISHDGNYPTALVLSIEYGGSSVPENAIAYVGTVPSPQMLPEMNPSLKINLETEELFYDYYRVDTIQDRISELSQANVELNLTIGNLVLESANDKATISSLEETVGTLLFEVAALKGGAG